MASEHVDENIEDIEEDDQFIDDNDVFVEIGDNGDVPMDEDDYDVPPGEDGEEVVFEDNSIQHFPTHKGSVFAVSMHPSQPIAASGGEDDLGYLWNVQDGEVIVKLTGHTDSVTCVAFNANGDMVATGGMDGKVRLWRHVGKEDWKLWEFMTELQGPDEVMVRLSCL